MIEFETRFQLYQSTACQTAKSAVTGIGIAYHKARDRQLVLLALVVILPPDNVGANKAPRHSDSPFQVASAKIVFRTRDNMLSLCHCAIE